MSIFGNKIRSFVYVILIKLYFARFPGIGKGTSALRLSGGADPGPTLLFLRDLSGHERRI
jgi:hypothetical protein